MRILIIEDEKKTAAFLSEGLAEAGFVTDIAFDGEDGRFKALNSDYDLIILDAMLPRLDGWALLARRQGEVLARWVIAEQVWDMNFDGDSNVVDVAVRRLRRKVDDPFAVKLIHTARGMGYVLERRD